MKPRSYWCRCGLSFLTEHDLDMHIFAKAAIAAQLPPETPVDVNHGKD